MSVRTNENYEQAERDGETELVLVVVTYVGERSVFNNDVIRSQGGYPALDGFQNGQPKFVRLPSGQLGWWERNNDFEVAYDEDTMAEALLERNFIPSQITGPGYDPEIRDQILDKLGLEVSSNEEGYREQLRDIVGVEDEESEDENSRESSDRIRELSSLDRSILIKVANSYDDIDDYLDEVDKSSVSHLSQHEAAEFLADKDDGGVDNRVEQAEMGQEI